jgi:hypothetical protein
MTDIIHKQVCKCEHCGNEAEMEITCTLPEPETRTSEPSGVPSAPEGKTRIKGTAHCSHCGNEADMWIDYPQS